MPGLSVVPISRAGRAELLPLLDEEEQAWMAELGWDYAPIRRILEGFIDQGLLPGYVASAGRRAVGYVYFLVHHHKGIIGALFASASPERLQVADDLLVRAIGELKAVDRLRRIEAQIIPFAPQAPTAIFTRHGFGCFPRYFCELDLGERPQRAVLHPRHDVVPWTLDRLAGAARVILRSYADQTDAQICEDYTTAAGCEASLRGLIENPGCGVFLPPASFTALDAAGAPCGIVLTTRISERGAMIAQVAVAPEHQTAGLGGALVQRALRTLGELGFRTVSLTVSKKNRRAFDWYWRLGFRVRKEFGAYVWQR